MNLIPFNVYCDCTNLADMREMTRQVLGATWVNRRWKWPVAGSGYKTCSDNEMTDLASRFAVLLDLDLYAEYTEDVVITWEATHKIKVIGQRVAAAKTPAPITVYIDDDRLALGPDTPPEALDKYAARLEKYLTAKFPNRRFVVERSLGVNRPPCPSDVLINGYLETFYASGAWETLLD